MVEEEIEDIQPSQLLDTNTIPKLRHKLLPRPRLANTLNKIMVNKIMVNNQEDINKDKDKENGPLNNLLKHTTRPVNITKVQSKVRMEMEVTE